MLIKTDELLIFEAERMRKIEEKWRQSGVFEKFSYLTGNFSFFFSIFGQMLQTKETTNFRRRTMPAYAIIHLFALAHAVVAVVSRALNYYDDVPLTLLTISMVAILSIRYRLQVELSAVLILIASFVGFLAGGYGGLALRVVLRSDLWAPAITTFLVTELIGWSIWLFVRNRAPREADSTRGFPVAYIIFSAALILLIRIGYILIIRHLYGEQESLYPELGKLFSNTLAVLLLICSNLIAVQLYISNRHRIRKHWHHPLWMMLSILATSFVTTLYGLFGLTPGGGTTLTSEHILRLFVSVLLISIVAYALLFLIHYFFSVQRELRDERQRLRQAQWQYSRFKQQINPHFLFNSLNILDILVQEGERERASSFIRKLAGLYRYMLRNEEEVLVSLREEMEFADMYINLIKERFTDGLEIERDIPASVLGCQVPPCAVQLLIENATKHNIVSSEQPLRISLKINGDKLVVENNVQPRMSRRTTSTQLGLKNLSLQYLDIAHREIVVEQSEHLFRVELPLIKAAKQ